jgi:hypothetical protein
LPNEAGYRFRQFLRSVSRLLLAYIGRPLLLVWLD